MVEEKARATQRPETNEPVVQRPQRGWERITANKPSDMQTRTTFRVDAPSPSEEVLAQHDAAIGDAEAEAQDSESHITCF